MFLPSLISPNLKKPMLKNNYHFNGAQSVYGTLQQFTETHENKKAGADKPPA